MNLSEAFCREYQVLETLGEGGMGRVVLARQLRLRRLVAIKFLLEPVGAEKDIAARRFLEEARVSSLFRHPNVVALFDYGFEGGRPYLVFEYVQGEDLVALVHRRGRLGVEEALEITGQVLAALEGAHERGIVHRDLKPGNIILRADDGRAMVMDFGMAKARDRQSFHTRHGILLGTPEYMAPEAITGGEVTPRVDVYSVGCLLWELCSGKQAFTGKTYRDVMDLQVHKELKRLADERPEVGPAVSHVVERALAKDPTDRYADARSMRRALEEARRFPDRLPREATARVRPAPGARAAIALAVGVSLAVALATATRRPVAGPSPGIAVRPTAHEIPAPPIATLVLRLAAEIGRIEPGAIVRRLVNTPEYGNLRATRRLGPTGRTRPGANLEAGLEGPAHPDRWTDLVRRACREAGLDPPLARARALAPGVLADPAVPERARLSLYHALARLTPLDAFAAERGATAALGIAGLVAPVARSEHATGTAATPSRAGPDDVVITRGLVGFHTPDGTEAVVTSLELSVRNLRIRELFPGTGLPDVRGMVSEVPGRQGFRLVIPERLAGRPACLTVWTCHSRADYYYEVELASSGRGHAVTVYVADPRTGYHGFHGMGLVDPWNVARHLLRTRIHLAPWLLRPGECHVRFSLHHLPGVGMRDLHGALHGSSILLRATLGPSDADPGG